MFSKKYFFPVALLIVLLYFPYFSHLTKQPLRIWDETRQAFSAYEMSRTGNPIVVTYNYQPDLWNTKPPLLIWSQCLLMKIFGPMEFAVRFPAALCGLFTSLLLLYFSWKYYNRFWLGFIAALILCTIEGYTDYHGTRYGEYDSPLTLFSMCTALMCFLYFDTARTKYLVYATITLSLAFLTKGIAGLFFLPAIFLYALIRKKILPLLKEKKFYLCTGLFLFVFIGWYGLREYMSSGYLEAVWQNELGGRYFKPLEGHEASFWYYFDIIRNWFMEYWAILIPCGAVIGFADQEKRFRNLILYLSLIAVSFWLVISSGQTKLEWYIYPIMPIIAFFVANLIYLVFNLLKQVHTSGLLRYQVLPILFLFLVFIKPYKKIIGRTYLAPEREWEVEFYRTGYFLKDLVKEKQPVTDHLRIVFKGYDDHLKYYTRILSDKGKDVKVIWCDELKPGDNAVYILPEVKSCIEDRYTLSETSTERGLYFSQISGLK